MAGGSNKGKSKGKGKVASSSVAAKEVQPLTSATGLPELVLKMAPVVPAAVEAPKEAVMESSNVKSPASGSKNAEGADMSVAANDGAKSIPKEAEPHDVNEHGEADGDAELPLYPIAVKGSSGEHLELQVNPGDSVMDLRQFLSDAPETCFYTCYDLILISADGVRYQLSEYLEIGEVADISVGGCSLEMINALYDDRMVRSQVRRTRELISTASIHSSLSTALAAEYEEKQAGAAGEDKSKKDISASKDKVAGSVKTEVTELEGSLGFMEYSCEQLSSLIFTSESQQKLCVETIAFSSFNPVPGYRRLLGDLIYLDVVTAEGKNF